MQAISEISSHNQLHEILKKNRRSFLLLFKKGADSSDCAYTIFTEFEVEKPEVTLLFADVNRVRDIHVRYGITSAPSLLEFDKDRHINTFRGCNSKEQLKNIIGHAVFLPDTGKSETKMKRVTVYSTPTCSWCNTLKQYLLKNGVKFTDIDVSGSSQVSADMVRRSGQQGVPQTLINGELVIGFDRKKIDRLLEIVN